MKNVTNGINTKAPVMWGTLQHQFLLLNLEFILKCMRNNEHKTKWVHVLEPVEHLFKLLPPSNFPTYHFRGGLCVLCSHMLLQGHLCVAHPAAVRTCEGLGLLHWECFSPVVQVWRRGGKDERGIQCKYFGMFELKAVVFEVRES